MSSAFDRAFGFDEAEFAMIELVAKYVEEQVVPVASELERDDVYPAQIIDDMKAMGVFGLCIPDPWGESQVSTQCFAAITAELSRGWMSLGGAFGGHSVVSSLILRFGTDEQRDRYLPRMATGELRATMALTEAGGGSDLQAMRTTARLNGAEYIINGSKMWISNAIHSGLTAVLLKTDPDIEPTHRGMSVLLVEKVPGHTVSRKLGKLGYRGIDSCEVVFDDCRVPRDAVLGGDEGLGFSQMMSGLEIGRIQVASRAIGVAQAAVDESIRYAQERHAFGQPIWRHQSLGNYLANMATKVHAAKLLTIDAARRFDSGERSDLESGMAKLFASEVALEAAIDALRIHGGYGYSTEYPIERLLRDAPLTIVGEGTNEILRNVIARQLVSRMEV